jgi:hypothetical protein
VTRWNRAGYCKAAYLRAAQAYMLISIPTGTSTIFGAFQAILLLQCYGASAERAQIYVHRSNRASARVSHFQTSMRARERSWATFHKSGASAPHDRRYSSRYTTLAI